MPDTMTGRCLIPSDHICYLCPHLPWCAIGYMGWCTLNYCHHSIARCRLPKQGGGPILLMYHISTVQGHLYVLSSVMRPDHTIGQVTLVTCDGLPALVPVLYSLSLHEDHRAYQTTCLQHDPHGSISLDGICRSSPYIRPICRVRSQGFS